MPSPYTLTYPQRRRALLSFYSPCVSDFPRFPRCPPPLPPSPSPTPPLPSFPSTDTVYFPYPISHPSSMPPQIPLPVPDTHGLGISFGNSHLQDRVWALEQVDDPALALLQFEYDDDYDYEEDYWFVRFGRRVRKLFSFPVRLVLRKRSSWRG